MVKNIAIIGGKGALGRAFTQQLSNLYSDALINVFSRNQPDNLLPQVAYHPIDYQDEAFIKESALLASRDSPLDMVIVATGILHNNEIQPEKSLYDLSAVKFQRLFEINTIFPALIAKYFIPKLNKDHHSIFAALSARVGSISDNHLGGWYAYRASKAALNMVIKNAAIETGRRNKKAVIVGLHPGTVNSNLSKPYQSSVPDEKLFTPNFSANKLLNILKTIGPEQSGKCFAWDGKEIEP